MDIESDDSERWEDFFGSSTELAPSLLGIYDTLTSTLDASFNSDSNNSNNTSNNTATSYNSSSSNELHNGNGGHISDTSTISNPSSRHSSCSSDDKPSDYTPPHDSNNNNKNNNNNSNTNNEYPDSSSNCLRPNADKPNDAEPPASAALLKQKLSIEETDTCDGGSFSSARSNSSQSNLSFLSPTSQKSNISLHSNSSFNSNSSSSGSSPRSRDHTPVSGKHRNNIRVLSANVQRIINHSDAEPVDSVDIDALQQQQLPPTHLHSPVLSPVPSHRLYHKKSATPTTSTPFSHKVKLSCIPLSKVTGKLTQSGNELVETFDSSCEYLDALNFAQSEKKRFVKKPPTPAVVNIPGSCVDGEKTPTNAGSSARLSAFNFDSGIGRTFPSPNYEKLGSIQLIEMEQLAATTQLISAAVTNEGPNSPSPSPSPSPATPSSPATDKGEQMPPLTKEFIVASEPLSPCEIIETVNYKLLSQDLQQLTLNEDEFKGSDDELAPTTLVEAINEPLSSKAPVHSSAELIEAVNKPLISKPLVRSSSAACASTVAGSPLLTYARSKSLAAKANTLGGAVPIKLPTAEQLAELEEASKISAESLDRLTDIKSKFSPKESRKGPMLPEIAKLKHRPLSSSSICSTSSSSSSGSDQLNGKLATSYLASVESLADQSENELMDPHRGMSVFERSCLEIVDSERSYVEDLGQVIRGYLMDWKERACLSCNELQVLFSNIEEIYEFNSTLLKQLINSGMDPVKIAKCFIDLRERFDVYTKYCTSYPEAISLLTKLLQATHTNALLTSTQKMLQQTLPLGSYLLKPVQRILKYHLLLDNLRKHCDVKEALQAYEIMRQVARNIDQVKRKLEQQSRVKELSGILDGWLGPELTVLGELRQEGLLVEHNKPRMVFLFTTMLIITKPKEDSRLQFKSYIHQNNLMLNEHLPGEPTSFYVIPYDEPRSQIKLTAKNRDQKRLWAQHIKGVILEKFDNIPVRAKELVYKLGDEEDRTPDKNTWKWSLHSTSSTPIYLERRNQYRRSEIRNRSKFKRKTVANSSSFDSFSEIAETVAGGKESPPPPPTTKPTGKSLSRNNSVDDNMLPALQKLAAAIKTKHKPNEGSNGAETNAPDRVDAGAAHSDTNNKSNSAKETASCVQRRSAGNAPKSPLFGGKMLKERSKSVPRNSFSMEDLDEESESLHGSTTNLDARKSKSTKSIEVKQYNHKTLPKRIVSLKKQRTSKKETSTFYMDLDEFEDSTTTTALKIVESTENLMEKSGTTVLRVDEEPATSAPDAAGREQHDESPQAVEALTAEQPLTPAEKAKKDAQIIRDLLKETKEFERMSKKPPKKRSFDHSVSTPTSPDSHGHPLLIDLPPRPPSRSPPPLEPDCDAAQQQQREEEEKEEGEPIYESLLRNVHVPYKFSPVLGRSKSTQYYTPRERKLVSPPPPRPESDYVTLVYSAEGALQKVGDDPVQHEPQLEQRDSTASSASSSSTSTVKRDSQNTVIHFDCSSSGNISQLSTATSKFANGPSEATYARPIPKNLMKRLLNGSGSKSSPESISTSQNSLLPRARKSIDNIALSFGRSNKPPERRVSDVTEMCRQSILHRQGSEAVGERMAHVDYADPKTLFGAPASSEASLQRDSVFSLTSSNDSVCEHNRNKHNDGLAGSALTMDFAYEDSVEECLENDFRDSAIYSDDNDKRVECEIGDCIKRPTSPPPPPPRNRNRKLTDMQRSKVAATAQRPVDAQAAGDEGAALPPSVVLCPPHLGATASRSWVLKQIDNFSK